MNRRSRLTAAFVAAAVTTPAVAGASEGEKALSVSAGYAALGDSRDGASLSVGFDRGMGKQWFLHIEGTAGVFPDDDTAYFGQATAGIRYLLLDVVKYVPVATLGVGAVVLGGGAIDTDIDPRLELGLGLDVLTGRTFSWGLEARFEVGAPRASFEQTSLFLAGAKIAWRWGFF